LSDQLEKYGNRPPVAETLFTVLGALPLIVGAFIGVAVMFGAFIAIAFTSMLVVFQWLGL